MNARVPKILTVLVTGVLLGAVGALSLSPGSPAVNAETSTTHVTDLAAEIGAIKDRLPDQSHAMRDVDYHFSNLWFAGKHENWDLANFYWSETRSHLRWAVRIIPVRKDNAGREIKLKEILEAFENGPLKQLHEAVVARDKPQFEKEYRVCLETCYACHKASDKPYLHPQIPTRPETAIINFDPAAEWPR